MYKTVTNIYCRYHQKTSVWVVNNGKRSYFVRTDILVLVVPVNNLFQMIPMFCCSQIKPLTKTAQTLLLKFDHKNFATQILLLKHDLTRIRLVKKCHL